MDSTSKSGTVSPEKSPPPYDCAHNSKSAPTTPHRTSIVAVNVLRKDPETPRLLRSARFNQVSKQGASSVNSNEDLIGRKVVSIQETKNPDEDLHQLTRKNGWILESLLKEQLTTESLNFDCKYNLHPEHVQHKNAKPGDSDPYKKLAFEYTGVGTGQSPQEAKKAAAADLISQLPKGWIK